MHDDAGIRIFQFEPENCHGHMRRSLKITHFFESRLGVYEVLKEMVAQVLTAKMEKRCVLSIPLLEVSTLQ